MDEDEIGRKLDAGQAAVDKTREAAALRREAVMLAIEHGWTKYKIAARLGVKGPTVDAIVKSANAHRTEETT